MPSTIVRDAAPKTMRQRADELIELGPDAVTSAPDDLLRYLARQYVTDRFKRLERGRTRAAEGRVRREYRTSEEVTADDVRLAMREVWAALVGKSFALPDGRVIGWHEATRKDHLDRIGYQTDLIVGIEHDIALHEKAVAALDRCGVESLGQL